MQKIEKVFNKTIKSNLIHDAILYVENANGNLSYSKGYGEKKLDSPILMASITKLFTTTCILALSERGSLSLDDKLSKYFDNSIMTGLHIYNDKEYSFGLTISDLLFQISGLPDSFEDGKTANASVVMNAIVQKDEYLKFDAYLAETKGLNPRFIPRTPSKAYYANINFDLLGHSGSTGSFAFYYPTKDLYMVGDLNQMANSALPIRLVIRLAMSV